MNGLRLIVLISLCGSYGWSIAGSSPAPLEEMADEVAESESTTSPTVLVSDCPRAIQSEGDRSTGIDCPATADSGAPLEEPSKPTAEAEPAPQPEIPSAVQPQSPTESQAEAQSEAEPANLLDELPDALQLSTLRKIPLSESELRAKVQYAEVMLQMGTAKRIFASDHEQAKALLEQARNKSAAAQQALANNQLAEADELVNQCYRTMAIAATLVPSPHTIQMAKNSYQQQLDGLLHAKELNQQAYDGQPPEQRLEYDSRQVFELEQLAQQFAEQGDHHQANHQLEQARMLVDLATMGMLHQQTVVYAVDVSTAEKEFAYEAGRYTSYEELIPVAIEMTRPNKMQLMLINRRVNQGEWMAEQAHLTAQQGDHAKAIRMIMDAASEIRKALKLMKIKVYE